MTKGKPKLPDLLGELYEGAANPSHWPHFLSRLAALFNAGTASLRIIDATAPVVHRSFTVGFDHDAARRYEEQLVTADPFREFLSRSPPGVIQASHTIIRDREFERSEHFQGVFRPNGNFYAMGAHVERTGQRALQIGIHRPHRQGPFQEQDRAGLEFFSPHLRHAARLMRLVDEFEATLHQAKAALDRLPFAVWLMDHGLHCEWMNTAAEDAVRTGVFGLKLRSDCLAFADSDPAGRLRSAADAIHRGRSDAEIVGTAHGGACLLLASASREASLSYGLSAQPGMLVFLLDPERQVVPGKSRLRRLYGLTPAECRLLGEFLQGLDLAEASARLGISLYTARSQLKSVMQKTNVNRQAELMRKLLLGPGSLRPEDQE